MLEAEYARNPKPDKAARMLIVKRVALGEKEVQVSMLSNFAVLNLLEDLWSSQVMIETQVSSITLANVSIFF